MSILDDLLDRGYLPIQLPPLFTSSTFAAKRKKFEKAWEIIENVPSTRGEKYSVARSSYYRRTTTLVNPIGFYHLAKAINQFLPKIKTHYKKTPLSRSVPEFGTGKSPRAIGLTRFSELHEEKITTSAGYKFALVTDISSFFPTIYTHTIPWALHTKAVAKIKRQKTARYFGNILDAQCMALQDRQTIGLPIGPDTSHIVAEIIGTAIDILLHTALGKWPCGFRYVDDFYLFFARREEAEKALAVITRAVNEFELHINPAKTRIIEVKELVDESWKYSVRNLSIASERRQQRDDIHHFFEVLFSLEKRFKDESLVKYGLKRLSSTIIKKSNWPVIEAYLFKCGYSFPNTLQTIAHLFATYQHYKYPLDLEAISRFCNTMLRAVVPSNHHGEASWLLWMCKNFGIILEPGIIAEILRMRSSVNTLLALDLHHYEIAAEAPDIALLKEYAQPDALTGSDWLLSYEAGRRLWLGNTDTQFIANHSWFGPLLAAKVKFYDETIIPAPIFTEKLDGLDGFSFDGDEEIESHFTFDDLDEEYFDSGKDAEDSEEDF